MRDAITGLIGRYDQLGRYFDRSAIDRIEGYFGQAELRRHRRGERVCMEHVVRAHLRHAPQLRRHRGGELVRIEREIRAHLRHLAKLRRHRLGERVLMDPEV